MEDRHLPIQWTPRVPKSKIRRLYESDAAGRIDEELLDDVGMTLLLRCEDILVIADARQGRLLCPMCKRRGERTIVPRRTKARDELLRCDRCGWEITWADYLQSFKRRQLHIGGAGPAFRRYVKDYPQARSTRDRMLAVDRLIHEFHYSLRDQPDRPTRACCVNLISGRLTDVVHFLDELSGLTDGNRQLAETHAQWSKQCHNAGQWHPK
jgi:predicted RNA-binding Zn-ribbon protein involved in translation (DUF1610 family)